MLRIDAGPVARKYCDGLRRRDFIQLGVAGMGSLTLPGIMRAQAASESPRKKNAVILLWLDGGPSHMDLYDLKPEAPAEYRGLWKPIPTNVPGMMISELFPRQARIADKFSIVRSLHHDNGDHFSGAHAMLTSRIAGVNGLSTGGKHPSIGSVISKLRGSNAPGMPAYCALPYAMSIGLRPGYFDASYLGSAFRPFEAEGDPNARDFQIQNIVPPGGLSINQLDDRKSLLGRLDGIRRTVDRSGMMDSLDRFQQDAYEMVVGPAARQAFDLSKEDPRLRDQYGRHSWGQGALLSRRLVEAGCAFVTCHYGGWDHHWDLKQGMDSHLPKIDSAVSTLFADLDARGLLDQVTVVMCGEFSRTPRMNDGGNGGPPRSMGTPGRDHWGAAMFCLMGGGGVKGGQVVGSTDRLGERPKDRPLAPSSVHATLYKVLGIDPTMQFLDHAGRPVPILDDPAPISELI